MSVDNVMNVIDIITIASSGLVAFLISLTVTHSVISKNYPKTVGDDVTSKAYLSILKEVDSLLNKSEIDKASKTLDDFLEGLGEKKRGADP